MDRALVCKGGQVRSIAISVVLSIVVFIFAIGIDAKGFQGKNSGQTEGAFKFAYAPVKDPRYAALQQEFMKEKVLESLAASLNGVIALPVDVTIGFTECGMINAFYDPSAHRIDLCYELVERFVQIFQPIAQSEEELGKAIEEATTFIFFHELGHALAHVLELPITGKEEDAVDQLSTLLLTSGSDQQESAALSGAAWFLLEG